jgi:hypothetical protein
MAAWHVAQASFPGVLEEETRLCARADPAVGVAAFGSVCALVGQPERQLQHKHATTSAMMVRCLCRERRQSSSPTVPVSDDSESGETREVGRFKRAEIISRHTTTKTKGEQQQRQTLLGPADYSEARAPSLRLVLFWRDLINLELGFPCLPGGGSASREFAPRCPFFRCPSTRSPPFAALFFV